MHKYYLNRALFISFVMICSLTLAKPAFSWGAEGHRIVALIAQRNLSPEAEAYVTELLSSEGRQELSQISSWADQIRKLRRPQQPFHSVRIPMDSEDVNEATLCRRNKRCIFETIDANIKALRHRTVPIEARVMALKYLVHLIGDIHQPLHASEPGKELVRWNDKVTSLHRVWDSQILNCDARPWDAIAASLSRPSNPITIGRPLSWALESRDIARDNIFTNSTFTEDGVTDLDSQAYCAFNLPVVQGRLQKAGIRLAATLNQIAAKLN